MPHPHRWSSYVLLFAVFVSGELLPARPPLPPTPTGAVSTEDRRRVGGQQATLPVYSAIDAARMIRYAAVSYYDAEVIQSWSGELCDRGADKISNIKIIQNDTYSVLGFVGATSDGNIVVSFRGTKESEIKTWVDDLKFTRTSPYNDLPEVKVHLGFYECWMSVAHQVTSAINHLGANKPLLITGHSSGASQATLGAFQLWRASSSNVAVQVWSFGQPRTGNSDWALAFEAEVAKQAAARAGTLYWRVTHSKDVVPHVPPSSLLDYTHAKPEVYYDEPSAVVTICPEEESSKCSNQCGYFCDSIQDHYRYLNVSIP
jgi:hypothetical protein